MNIIDIHDSFDKYKCVIIVKRGKSRQGNTDYYSVHIPLPHDGALVFVNISLYASNICSRRYNPDLQSVAVRYDNLDTPEAIAASLGLHHFNDAGRIVASIL